MTALQTKNFEAVKFIDSMKIAQLIKAQSQGQIKVTP